MEPNMLESTKLIDALNEMRKKYDTPPSHMELIRGSVLSELSRAGTIEMPPILSVEQRKSFVENLDLLADFLATDNGADAIELLVNSFEHFVSSRVGTPIDADELDEGNDDDDFPTEGM